MTNEEINIAIAEVRGWKEAEPWLNGDRCFEISGSICGYRLEDIPNYCNDLNAMHEAEKTLDYEQLCDMQESIKFHHAVIPFHATAYQRAEAFLRTIAKWEEAK